MTDKELKKLNDILESPEILALKKGKQGKKRVMKETDIKQFIEKYNLFYHFLHMHR